MKTVLMVTQVIFSVLLALVILAQQKGTGLSATFGGGGGFYTSKRGIEKFLSVATVVLAALFLANSIAFLFV
ncbi:MAG: preprotein translocase subunit SecG [Candidatus Peregrinibacteria bacterium]|nr:preprotein translocase subunit SecG [Candidatus Peregrinibacteria bacterium]